MQEALEPSTDLGRGIRGAQGIQERGGTSGQAAAICERLGRSEEEPVPLDAFASDLDARIVPADELVPIERLHELQRLQSDAFSAATFRGRRWPVGHRLQPAPLARTNPQQPGTRAGPHRARPHPAHRRDRG